MEKAMRQFPGFADILFREPNIFPTPGVRLIDSPPISRQDVDRNVEPRHSLRRRCSCVFCQRPGSSVGRAQD